MTPSAPWQQIDPEPMPEPATVSPAAMALLEAIYDGADVRVFWRFRVATPTVNGEDMSRDWWRAYEKELSRQVQGRIFDGFHWMTYTAHQHCFTTEPETYNDEDGIEHRIELNDAGRAFVLKQRKANLP